MPPKKAKKKASVDKCNIGGGGQFYVGASDDMFGTNWYEILCFPYILCGRIFSCFITLCGGGNGCLLYWMAIQWCLCKFSQLTTPDPVMFPYFFHMFFQVLVLTFFFIFLWRFFGKSVFIPYFMAFYEAFRGNGTVEDTTTKPKGLAFRKYCFRKGEIFDSPVDNHGYTRYPNYLTPLVGAVVDLFLYEILY